MCVPRDRNYKLYFKRSFAINTCFFYPYSSVRQSVCSEQSREDGRSEPIPEPGKWVGQSSQANRGLLYKVLCGNRGELELSTFKINILITLK